MKAILGVSRKKDRLMLSVGEFSYWCVFRKYKVEIGDILFLYFVGDGVRQIYQITDAQPEKGKMECDGRGMKTVEIALKAILKSPLSAKELKAHPVLKKMGAVSRNFQHTVFELKNGEMEALLQALQEKNPGLSPNLEGPQPRES